jgi:hypothetical protein
VHREGRPAFLEVIGDKIVTQFHFFPRGIERVSFRFVGDGISTGKTLMVGKHVAHLGTRITLSGREVP